MRVLALPSAREKGLVVQDLSDVLLVYDQDRHKIHHLNPTIAFVWRHCDGRTEVDEVARLLENKLDVASGEEAVQSALGQLEKNHLLQKPTRHFAKAARVA